MVYGIWYMVYGIWYMVYGIWYMVYGIRYTVYGIRYTVYGIFLQRNRATSDDCPYQNLLVIEIRHGVLIF
jgi:hypothetical protein